MLNCRSPAVEFRRLVLGFHRRCLVSAAVPPDFVKLPVVVTLRLLLDQSLLAAGGWIAATAQFAAPGLFLLCRLGSLPKSFFRLRSLTFGAGFRELVAIVASPISVAVTWRPSVV